MKTMPFCAWISSQRVEIMTKLLNLKSKQVTVVPDLITENKSNTMDQKTTRAKFSLSVLKQEDGSLNVSGAAVCSDDPKHENKAFSDATPSGSFFMNIAKDKEAQNNFKEGTHEYYLDIVLADTPAAASTENSGE